MLNQMTHRLAFVGAILALLVIMLGAYTRITGSGLGCPDWPGCYGQWHVPDTLDQIYRAQTHYPNSSLVSAKAWTEMIHRYLAGSLVLVILAIAATAWRRRRLQRDGLLPFILVPLILLQALLGMWTVTLKLNPAVVNRPSRSTDSYGTLCRFSLVTLSCRFQWSQSDSSGLSQLHSEKSV